MKFKFHQQDIKLNPIMLKGDGDKFSAAKLAGGDDGGKDDKKDQRRKKAAGL